MSLASAAGQRGRFGALRAAEVAHNPSIWDIDVTQSGKMCVSNASSVQAMAAGQRNPITVNIRSSDGKSQDLDLGRGQRPRPLAGRATDHRRR